MEITNNKRQSRFEVALTGGETAILDYRWLKGSMVLMHTVVPASGRGQGIGGALAAHVLQHARSHGLAIIVYCPFVAKFIKDHPGQYDDLVAQLPGA